MNGMTGFSQFFKNNCFKCSEDSKYILTPSFALILEFLT